ncbi:MAG TPA: DUF4349 domain-containing protein, partial [Solirubrobacteraceae bacterium]|nr:DUF4349 domain-containing protein [Solirubrobacteraceae bacterium]
PGQGGATFLLRVPSASLGDALARLSRLAHVASLQQSSTDVTGSYDALAARLRDARAERSALLNALAKASTAGEIASLRARLAIVRGRIGALQQQLDGLRGQARMASVEVSVDGRRRAAVAPHRHPWSPGDALHDAGRVLEVAAGAALVGGAALLPLALLATAAALAARSLRRRRREQALDAV